MYNTNIFISTCMLLAVFAVLSACGNHEDGNNGKIESPETNKSAKVSTFAGTAVGMGYIDGTGSDARFRLPRGIASDGDNLYIVDTWNHIIRKLVIATGDVTTLAGVARSQNFIDGVGDDARLFSPSGITIVEDTIYFTDRNTVRSIDIATRKVVTIAGAFSIEAVEPVDGVGTEARFGYLVGITTDGTSLFVVESASKAIRKIDIATRTVTTLANGVGKPGYQPDLLVSDDSYLYLVTSYGSTSIEKIEISTGTVTTLNGPWSYMYSISPNFGGLNGSRITGIAKQNEFFYVADSSGVIRRINIDAGDELILAGKKGDHAYRDGAGEEARFWQIKGMVIDGGNLIVSDELHHNIRKIEIATGNVSTLAGSGPQAVDDIGEAARFFQPHDVTSDGEYLYVTDQLNYTIRKISLMTGMVTTLAGKAGIRGTNDGTGEEALFSQPGWITNDGTHLYVTDYSTVRKIEISTGVVTTLAGQESMQSPSKDGIGSNAYFNYPSGITTDGIYLYVADWAGPTIRKIHPITREVTTLAGTPNVAGFSDGTGVDALFDFPTDIATDGTSLFVSDENNSAIRKIDIKTGIVTTVTGMVESDSSGKLLDPMGITISGDFLFVTDRHTIRRISIESGSVSTIAGGINDYSDGSGNQARFNFPKGITLVGSKLYVADTNNHVIRRIEDIDFQ